MKKGILFCNAGFSSSLISAKLNEFGKDYGISFEEAGFGSVTMNSLIGKYDVVLLAPHLKFYYDEYEDLFEENNIAFIQVSGKEYIANGEEINNLFDRIKTALDLK